MLLDVHDSYIVVSFVNATLVLSIGQTVEEVTDSGFLPTAPTVAVGRVGDDSLVQVCMKDAYAYINMCVYVFPLCTYLACIACIMCVCLL